MVNCRVSAATEKSLSSAYAGQRLAGRSKNYLNVTAKVSADTSQFIILTNPPVAEAR